MRYQSVATTEDGAEAGLLDERRDTEIDACQNCPSTICFWMLTILVFFLVIITFPISGWFVFKMVPSQERFVVLRLGRIIGSKGPGIIFMLPFIDQWQVVDLRTKSFTVGLFEAVCKDEARLIVGAEVSYHVSNPVLSVAVVQDIRSIVGNTAKAVMISFLLKKTLASIKKHKTKLEEHLSFEMTEKTRPWGVQVEQVNLIVHSVLKYPQEVIPSLATAPPSSRLNRLPQPLQKIARHIGHGGSSAPSTPSQRDSEYSSENEETIQILSEGIGYEEPEKDRISPDWVLSRVQSLLSEELVKQIRACYLFIVNQKNGTQNLYHLDLSRDSGYAGYGMPEKEPDVTLEVTERTMQALFTGATKPFSAYMSGRVRIQGDLKVAMKLEDLIKKLQQ